MKLSKLFFGLATAAMFAACSSDDIVVAEQPQAQWNEDGTGYIALNIGMPTPKASRAATANINEDDGLSSEYDVKNGVLLLFAGADEEHAECYAAYDLTDTNFGLVGSTTDGVTSDKLIVQKIDKPATPATYMGAFVVLNTNENFKVDASTHKLTTPASITTIASLHDAQKTGIGTAQADFRPVEFIGNGFMMTNAPLYTKVGGTTTPAGNLQFLAKIDQSKIMGTKNEASKKDNCAATVYVERAVAKVTMHAVTDKAVTSVTTPGQTNFKWTLNSWALDNTNKESYLTRNTTNFNQWEGLKSFQTSIDDYRFVGSTTVAHAGSSVGADGTVNLYRTYWAQDPNYSTVEVPGYFNTKTANDTHYSAQFGNDYPQYCAENTFNVEHQNWQNTTRVLLKTTMTPATSTTPGKSGTFFGRPGDEGFLDEDNVAIIVYNHALEALKGMTGYGELGAGNIEFDSYTFNTTTGEITVKLKGTALDNATGAGVALAATAKAGLTYLPADLGISYYKGGVVYYQARIRHFDDTQTPWNDAEFKTGFAPASGSTLTIYPDADDSRRNANYLGRWGVLRNNWYDLNIDKVTKLGYATPQELEITAETGKTPDDNIENWISLDVNILSWTKRTNNMDL